MDLGLPGMDGYAMAQALRAELMLADLVIVAIGGYGQPSDRDKTRAAGFDAHLVKPIDLDKAYRVLAHTLVQRGY